MFPTTKQPIVAPNDIKRYFVIPKESGELCLMSCIFGEKCDIFFPKLSEELHLVTFSDIAIKYLKEKGLEPHICQSEEEARSFFNNEHGTRNNKHETTNTKQQTRNNKHETTNNKQQTTNNKHETTNNKQQTTNNKFRPVADYSMPNVSDKVVKIILGYTDYIKRTVWSEA